MRRALLLLPLLLAACQTPAPQLAGAGMDMFTPIKVRIHPFTRSISNQPVPAPSAATPTTLPATAPANLVELHLEFSDQFSDTTKSPGTVSIQLFDAVSILGVTRKGALLGHWDYSLDTPESNRDHWDRTTRTYLFKFPLPPAVANLPKDHDRALLTVGVSLPNHAILSDEYTLPLK